MSVPLFMMLSGYLYYGKERTPQENATRIWNRIGIPLFSFFALYTITTWLFTLWRGQEYNPLVILQNVNNNTHSPLYFLVVLALIQLLNPLWQLLAEPKNSKLLHYTFCFFTTLAIVAQFAHYLTLREGDIFNTYTLWIMWIGYYLFGFIVRQNSKILSRKEIQNNILLFLGGFAGTVFLTYAIMDIAFKGITDFFVLGGQFYADSYLSITVFAMAFGAFNLLMRTNWPRLINTPARKAFIFLSPQVFALYLIHPEVIDILDKGFGVSVDNPTMPGILGYLLLNTILVLSISTVLVWIFRSTPILKKAVGE